MTCNVCQNTSVFALLSVSPDNIVKANNKIECPAEINVPAITNLKSDIGEILAVSGLPRPLNQVAEVIDSDHRVALAANSIA